MSEPSNKHEAQAAYDKARAALLRFKADSLDAKIQASGSAAQRRAEKQAAGVARLVKTVATKKACLEARLRRARMKTDHANPESFPDAPDKLSHRVHIRAAQLAERANQPSPQSAYQIWFNKQWAGVRKAELALDAAEQALKIKIARAKNNP